MTYSIVARCPDTGRLGIAIATCLPCVGKVARFLEPRVGVVASQARLLPAHGERVLAGLRDGATPGEALTGSLTVDEGAAHRQVAVVAADGRVAAHTGERCIPFASHLTGDGWSAQANMMTRRGVPEAMAAAFEASRGEHLAWRLLDALDAAEALGGDIRGRQSAAIHVQEAEPVGDLLVDVVVDVRVDDDPEPLVPLRRTTELVLGYDEGDTADRAVGVGDLDEAGRHLREALRLTAHDPQPAFWHAVTLAGAGYAEAARSAWSEVKDRGGPGHWGELVERMVRDGLLPAAVGEVLPPARGG